MKIDGLKPGRELDAIVAEKVMGWENNKNGPRYAGWREEQIWAMNEGPIVDCPCYSTDIKAAWEVFEKLKWMEPDISWNDELNCWHAMFWKGKKSGIASAGLSASHAISLAGLEAVGFKEEDLCLKGS